MFIDLARRRGPPGEEPNPQGVPQEQRRPAKAVRSPQQGPSLASRPPVRAECRRGQSAHNAPPRLVAAAQKAATELGWKPRYPHLDQIVQTAWDWHVKHPDGYPD